MYDMYVSRVLYMTRDHNQDGYYYNTLEVYSV